MGIDVLNIWQKTGTYKDIQDCEKGDILILSDGMILQVEINKKFALKIKAKVLQTRKQPKHVDRQILMASTPHPKGNNMFDGFIEYIQTVPMTEEWTYEYLLQRGAKRAGEVAKHLYE